MTVVIESKVFLLLFVKEITVCGFVGHPNRSKYLFFNATEWHNVFFFYLTEKHRLDTLVRFYYTS